MRIVYLSGSGQLGGAERCLLDVMQSVHQREPSWELALIASRDGPLLGAARALGVDASVEAFPGRLAGLGDSAAGGHAARAVGVALRAAGA
ncbi:MAG: glycosyl transferase family 1, partial [Gemmatimonadota bacterium]|nr:glycosyl transferase family 1 [Gemmatimonadota bacterium]